MEAAAIEVFGYGLVAALSPTVVIATVVLLSSGSGRGNGVLFLVGFVITLVVISMASLLLADRLGPGEDDPTVELILELGIGLLLLAAAWTERPGQDAMEGGGSRSQRLFARLDGISAPAALGVGALMAVLPRRLVLSVLVGITISTAGLAATSDLVLDALYVLTASVLVWLTVLVALASGARSEPLLMSIRAWLTANAQTVVFVVSLSFGVLFTGSALIGLLW